MSRCGSEEKLKEEEIRETREHIHTHTYIYVCTYGQLFRKHESVFLHKVSDLNCANNSCHLGMALWPM